MNKKAIFTLATTAITSLILGLVLGHFGTSNSNRHFRTDGPPASQERRVRTETPTIWTCSMHPQIQQSEPGDCPICGMDLIPLHQDMGSDSGPRSMSMSESSRALAEIQTSVVKRDFPEMQIRLVGKLNYDETRVKSLTARFPARIDELFVNFNGIRVRAGEHLAKVYSPELLTAQKELLSAYRADPEGSITRSSHEKLRLWDLLPEQIENIIQTGEARDHFELKAPLGGIVVEKHVNEGDYVKTGESLFKIVDLSVLWATLDAYESDLTWLRFGQDVAFTVEAFPGETFHGRIAFIDPEVNRNTRTIPIRVNVPNPDGRLKPGMFLRAIVKARLSGNGEVYAPEFAGKWISPMHPEIVKDAPGQCDVCGMDLVPAETLGYRVNADAKAPLVIPTSAVLRTGKRAVVYLELPERERPTYEGREITLGPRTKDSFIVLQGIMEGDHVVTHGAFKIDSALQIQARPSMMNPETIRSSERQHAGKTGSFSHDSHIHELPVTAEILELSVTNIAELLPVYLELQSALAADDFDRAKSALKSMMKITGHQGPIAELIHTMLAAESLDDVRRPHFETLSDAFISTARNHPESVDRELFVMHCPMVYSDHGADWLQASEPLQNPYFGAMMLTCGEIMEIIGNTQKDLTTHE